MRRLVVVAAVIGALLVGVAGPTAAAPRTLGGDSTQWPLTVTFDAAHLGGAQGAKLYVSRLLVSRDHPPLSDARDLAWRLVEDLERAPVNRVPDGKDAKQVWTVDISLDNYAAADLCVEPEGGARSCGVYVFHVGPGDPRFASWHQLTPTLCDADWQRITYSPVLGPEIAIAPDVVTITYASSSSELSVMPVYVDTASAGCGFGLR